MKIIFILSVVLLISATGCLRAPDYEAPTLNIHTGSYVLSARLHDTIIYNIEILSDNPLDSLIIIPARPGADGTDNTRIIFDKTIFNYNTNFTYIVKDTYPNVNAFLIGFEATNKIGTTTEYLKVELARSLKEYSHVQLDTFNCFFETVNGEIININDAPARYSILDFTYYLVNSIPFIGHTYSNPNLTGPMIYTGITTGFMNLNITNEDFDNIVDSREIIEIIGNADAYRQAWDGLRSIDIENQDIFGIVKSNGLKGVIKIDYISYELNRPMIFSIKSFNSH